ncbi:MAG TPA: DUF4332 domain-containing protein [Candidatus Thermoplasmatota archaeon]|nr:DUF4332 domain-containing protein [Candidatus Thermoplasmatota archaeon]
MRARVRKDRQQFPAVLRTCLWATLGLVAASSLAVALMAILDSHTLSLLVQMFVLSFAVGREAAMLYIYGQGPSFGPFWVLVAAIVDDLVTLGFTLPLVWLGLARLRGVYLLGGIVLSVEKTAVEKRAFLRRWGVYGLVAFVWLPGLGAGVFLAAAMGIVAKIPLRRLIIALAVGTALVNAFWAIGLYYTASLIPAEGVWSYIPIAFAAALGVVAAVFGWRQHRTRHLFPIVKVQILDAEHAARLADVGITDGNHLLYANRHVLARKLGIDPSLLGRLRSVAELSMLRTVSPRHAEMLTEVGINSIRQLSVAPPHLVAAALEELESKHAIRPLPGEHDPFPEQCGRWTEDARAFLAESDE